MQERLQKVLAGLLRHGNLAEVGELLRVADAYGNQQIR
jgi:hypothetical protein